MAVLEVEEIEGGPTPEEAAIFVAGTAEDSEVAVATLLLTGAAGDSNVAAAVLVAAAEEEIGVVTTTGEALRWEVTRIEGAAGVMTGEAAV